MSDNIEMVCPSCADEKYKMKGKFTDKDVRVGWFVKKLFENTEHMWVKVTKITNQGLCGTLDNDPIIVDMVCGDEVFVKWKDVEDILPPRRM